MFIHDVVMSNDLFHDVLYYHFCWTLYFVKMVVILLHILNFCTHQNHDIKSVSRFGAHNPSAFHAAFAIRSCYGNDFD